MIDLIAIITQPLIIVMAAVALLAGLIILQARRLRSVAKDPDLARLLMSIEGSEVLTLHKQALDRAKGETTDSLASARKILRSQAERSKRSRQRKS